MTAGNSLQCAVICVGNLTTASTNLKKNTLEVSENITRSSAKQRDQNGSSIFNYCLFPIHISYSFTRFDYFKSRFMAGFTDTNPLGARSRENLFSNHRTIRLMKPLTSTMLSAAIKKQYSSVLPLLHHCLTVHDKICGMATNFVFFMQVNTE